MNFILLLTFLFVAPFSTTPIFVLKLLIYGIVFCCLFANFFKNGLIFKVSKLSKWLLTLFFLPMFLSCAVVPITLIFLGSSFYAEYVNTDFVTRIINLILYLGVFIFGASQLRNRKKTALKSVLKAYLFGVSFLVLIGIWQWLHFTIGIPYLPIETRDYIHSVDITGVRVFGIYISNRLTSLTSEPSYLAPFLLDGIIIAMALYHGSLKKWFLFFMPTIFVLVFSFSGGGYVNSVFIVFSAFMIKSLHVFASMKLRKKYIFRTIFLAVIILPVIIIYANKFLLLLQPVTLRFTKVFDIYTSTRVFMVVKPFEWFTENLFINIIFGHGPGSFAVLSLYKSLPNGSPVHVTSNNMFSDVIFELGVFGFTCFIIAFVYLIWTGFSQSSKTREYFWGTLLSIHLLCSSLYRSDFMSPRFWAVLLCIIVLYQLGKLSQKKIWFQGQYRDEGLKVIGTR